MLDGMSIGYTFNYSCSLFPARSVGMEYKKIVVSENTFGLAGVWLNYERYYTM